MSNTEGRRIRGDMIATFELLGGCGDGGIDQFFEILTYKETIGGWAGEMSRKDVRK